MFIEDNLNLSLLFEMYGNLLTEKQKIYLDGYLNKNLSLTEIAEINSTSRQAVNDLIKRSLKLLNYYESKLKLLSKFQMVKKEINNLISLDNNKKHYNLKEKLNKILEVL